MKSVCFSDVGKVVFDEIPDPEIQDKGDVIVKTRYAGLCGSDLHAFHGRELGLDVGTVMGHEVVGEVLEVGNSVKKFVPGDIVFAPFTTSCAGCYYCTQGMTSRCSHGQLFGWIQDGIGLNGCQSELVRIPLADGTLKKVPTGLSDVSALLLGDNFSTGFYCAEMAEVKPGGVYAVIGCGTVGLLCIIAAKSLGAERIVAIDLVENRRRQAEQLGALSCEPDAAVQVIRELTDGRGADSVMELVGILAAQRLAYEIVRPGGIMSVIGCHCTPNFAFSPVEAYDKNLTYRTGRCPARHYMDRLTQRVVEGEFEIDSFVTHTFAAEECVKAYDVFSNRDDNCLKAMFRFD